MEEPQKAKVRRNKWYSIHKDEPGFKDILNQSRKKFYDANKESERAKARERYYRRRDAPLVQIAQEVLDTK